MLQVVCMMRIGKGDDYDDAVDEAVDVLEIN